MLRITPTGSTLTPYAQKAYDRRDIRNRTCDVPCGIQCREREMKASDMKRKRVTFKQYFQAIVERSYYQLRMEIKQERQKEREKRLASIAIWLMRFFVPIEKNKIFIITSRGGYQCNPRWICEELLRRKAPVKIVWTIRKRSDCRQSEFPKGIKRVKRGSYDMVRALCSAKVIVDNSVNTTYMLYKKRRGQYLLETWHGSLGIKRADADAVPNKEWVYNAQRQGKETDFCLSNSEFENEVFRTSYWPNTPILMTGHARNDILCRCDPDEIAHYRSILEQKYDIGKDQHICLYGPTFRDTDSLQIGITDYAAVKAALEKRFGGSWVICVRAHFLTLKTFEASAKEGDFIDVSEYPDIQDILLCTDAAITDYSSWICDYLLMKRPGFLLASDLDEYEANRGFYYPLETLPFPICKTNEELVNAIEHFESEPFEKRCDAFLQEMGCIDDGHASERIVDKILELMNA